MPKWDVTLYYTASISYEIEADSEEEAEEKAKAIDEPKEVFAEKVT